MANKILSGSVVSAGAVIAGVDADNLPVTSSESGTQQYHLLGSDGPVHIAGDFSIVQDGFTSWTFEVEFTAPNDNQYRNIFTLGGTSDKKFGGLAAYTTNSGDVFSMVSSASGTTTDGYNNWLSGAAGQGWTDAPHRLTIIRDGNIGRTAIYKDGEFVGTHQTKPHPTWSSSVKWPSTHFEGADLTFFAYADDSVLMGDGTGVEIHGWNFSKTNTYADQGVTGSGGTITNLLPLTQTAPETPNPYVDPYAGDFNMASPSGRAISWNGGWDAIDMLHWISYGTYGESGVRSINTPGGASAIHHMRYDPISKRVFALFTGGEAVLADNGFGGYSTSDQSHFFTGYYYNNVTWANPNMGVVASRNQYEPEEIAGLNITWNGTTWEIPAPPPSYFGSEGTTQTLTLDGVTKDVHVTDDGWVLYQSFSSDSQLTQSDAPAWSGNSVLMPDMSSYGWDTQYAMEYHDGTNVVGAGNNYSRPEGSIMFWGSSGINGSLNMTSWNGPSNATQVAVDWGYVDGFNTGHINVNNGPNITDQPLTESFDPTASDLMQIVEQGFSIVYVKSIWFKV